jgi:hypothetical protein
MNDTYDEIVNKIEQYWFGLMQLPPDGKLATLN